MEESDYENDKYNDLLENYVIPRLNVIISTLIQENPGKNHQELMTEALKLVFTDDIKEKFLELGIDTDTCKLDVSFFFISDDSVRGNIIESLSEATDDTERLSVIDKYMAETDHYKLMDATVDNVSIDAVELKPRLSIDDVEPISEEDFRKAFENGN
jgi:hypothetical protein